MVNFSLMRPQASRLTKQVVLFEQSSPAHYTESAGPVCAHHSTEPGTGDVSQESVFNWPILPNTDAGKHASAVHTGCLTV